MRECDVGDHPTLLILRLDTAQSGDNFRVGFNKKDNLKLTNQHHTMSDQ